MYLSQDAEDEALIARTIAGDPAAFGMLVEKYQRTLFTVAARMLGSREDAADAMQNALIRTYEHLQEFQPEHRFFSWIYRIVVNECLNMLRARRITSADDVEVVDRRGGAFEHLESWERRRAVQQALLELPHDLRAVIVLRHYAGLSYEEIGAALNGTPVKTVKSRLHTARQRLGRRLLGWSER